MRSRIILARPNVGDAITSWVGRPPCRSFWPTRKPAPPVWVARPSTGAEECGHILTQRDASQTRATPILPCRRRSSLERDHSSQYLSDLFSPVRIHNRRTYKPCLQGAQMRSSTHSANLFQIHDIFLQGSRGRLRSPTTTEHLEQWGGDSSPNQTLRIFAYNKLPS